MTIKKIFFLNYLIIITGVIILGILNMLMNRNEVLLNKKYEQRYQSYMLADELRQSSDDLTRMARTYVITGDPKYEKMYREILAIRNGQKKRPENYERIYWDLVLNYGEKPRPDGEAVSLQELMENQGIAEKEFAKLRKAQANSDALVKTETIAMNAVKGLYDDGSGNFTVKREADLEMARRIMHDARYHVNKARIMKPIDEFFAILDERTRSEVSKYLRKEERLLLTIRIVVSTLVFICISLFFITYRRLRDVVLNINEAASGVASGSHYLDVAAQQISQGVSEQAASAEEVSASVAQMATNISHSANNARATEKIALKSSEDVEKGGKAVSETVLAMKEIAQKISIIQEIARQTDLLALNAAIEAARAGSHGRGFAVVASEVRKLAERSQKAANGISILSNSSVEIAENVGNMVKKIVPDIQKTTGLVQEISAASNEQRIGAEQVNQSVQQLDQVIQQNAAESEEMTSTSAELSRQAEHLQDTIARLGFQHLRQKRKHEAGSKGSSADHRTDSGKRNRVQKKPAENEVIVIQSDDDDEFKAY
ncbi:methyl-accepting chemotaxis protein [Desulfonema ishimotonii]|uniref:Methyl-accepting chemotaxis protein n=1 Tax=Desulfonema ishimotonii TaxID=45657 RepID=A0A401G435_9BACT|nr:methyl-accepting chemotaxis protein [Desulfonema ishimotonii]GBC63974.1 methyl-accepting chemotaxis protein [Desulfonema ishimotonii]